MAERGFLPERKKASVFFLLIFPQVHMENVENLQARKFTVHSLIFSDKGSTIELPEKMGGFPTLSDKPFHRTFFVRVP